jgi:hypothetical protein
LIRACLAGAFCLLAASGVVGASAPNPPTAAPAAAPTAAGSASLLGEAGVDAAAVQLAPETLNRGHRRYADDVAEPAKQGPRLALKVCGCATAKDVAAVEPKNQPAIRDAEGLQPPQAESDPEPVALGASGEQALHELAVK